MENKGTNIPSGSNKQNASVISMKTGRGRILQRFLLLQVILWPSLLLYNNCGMVSQPKVENSQYSTVGYSHTGMETSCAACHESARPIGHTGWAGYNADLPFDYVTHGAGLDCATCHSPVQGIPTGHQEWATGNFDHSNASTCTQCHLSERPDVMGVAANTFAAIMANTTGFDHATSGTGDCIGCHQSAILNIGLSINGFNGSLPNGAWFPGASAPADLSKWNSAFDFSFSVFTNIASDGVIAAGTAQSSQTIHSPMNHQATNLDFANATTILPKCNLCHGAGGQPGPSNYGQFHAVLTTTPLRCSSCHSDSSTAGDFYPRGLLANHLLSSPLAPISYPRLASNGDFEMNHDAVVWTSGASGVPTSTKIVQVDCAVCHTAPAVLTTPLGTTWAMGLSGAVKPTFHDHVVPTSCRDCHTNSRPTVAVGTKNYLHNSGGGMGDCVGCHTAPANAATAAWSSGKFHKAQVIQPDTCKSCHLVDRPSAVGVAVNTTWSYPTKYITTATTGRSFDYFAATATNIPHGGDLDCKVCHTDSGMSTGDGGTWATGTQTWKIKNFTTVMHVSMLTQMTNGVAGSSTCVNCHTSQRPDKYLTPTIASTFATAINNFDHVTSGTSDCAGCHSATVDRGSYATKLPIAGTPIRSSDWRDGIAYPGSNPIGRVTIDYNAYVFTQNLIAPSLLYNKAGFPLTPILSKINAQIVHTSVQLANAGYDPVPTGTAVPLEMSTWTASCGKASPAGICATNTCYQCHQDTTGKFGTNNGAFVTFHSGHPRVGGTPTNSSITTCLECHKNGIPQEVSVPTANPELFPMRHAVIYNTANSSPPDCKVCHGTSGVGTTWANGVYHANYGMASTTNCTSCHFATMMNPTNTTATIFAPKVDVTVTPTATASNTTVPTVKMVHSSGAVTTQFCQSCHTNITAPPSSTNFSSWSGAKMHSPGSIPSGIATSDRQSNPPTTCGDCHNALPQTTTMSSLATAGVKWTGSHQQHMNHKLAIGTVTLAMCQTCHLADATVNPPAWNKATRYHNTYTTVATVKDTCTTCHASDSPGAVMVPAATYVATQTPRPTNVLVTSFLHTDPTATGLDCKTCHLQVGITGANSNWAGGLYHKNVTNAGTCATCHTRPAAIGAIPDHTSTTYDSCLGCHAKVGVSWYPAAATNHTVAANCTSCHLFSNTTHNYKFNDPTTTTDTRLTQGSLVTFNYPASGTLLVAGSYQHTELAGPSATYDCKTCHVKGPTVGTGGIVTLVDAHIPQATEVRTFWKGPAKWSHAAIFGTGVTGVKEYSNKTMVATNYSCIGCHTLQAGVKGNSSKLNEDLHVYAEAVAGRCGVCHGFTPGAALSTWKSSFIGENNAHWFRDKVPIKTTVGGNTCAGCHKQKN